MLKDFAQISEDFAQIFKDAARIFAESKFGVELHPLHPGLQQPRLLHQRFQQILPLIDINKVCDFLPS